jgi:hypothetical protein
MRTQPEWRNEKAVGDQDEHIEYLQKQAESMPRRLLKVI